MLQSAMLQKWLNTIHKKDNMKIGKLIWDDELGEANVKFNKNFYFSNSYEKLDAIKDIQKQLVKEYKIIQEEIDLDYEHYQMMHGDEIAASAYEEDAEYGPPIN